MAIGAPGAAAQAPVPHTIADSVADTLAYTEGQFLSIAEAMPEEKYSFVPTAGSFSDARSLPSR